MTGHPARRWEAKTLRTRLFRSRHGWLAMPADSICGYPLTTGGLAWLSPRSPVSRPPDQHRTVPAKAERHPSGLVEPGRQPAVRAAHTARTAETNTSDTDRTGHDHPGDGNENSRIVPLREPRNISARNELQRASRKAHPDRPARPPRRTTPNALHNRDSTLDDRSSERQVNRRQCSIPDHCAREAPLCPCR